MSTINKISIDDYITTVVNGYLLNDLGNMANLRKKPSEATGAVGFPMIMTTCTGIELLGGLLSEHPFSTKPSVGLTYFVDYWNNYLVSQNCCYKGYADTVYSLARHSIAHVFMTKPGITIIKDAGNVSDTGLTHTGLSITIDCIRFYLDFKRSVLIHLVPKIEKLKVKMQHRLDEMLEKYASDTSRVMSDEKIQVFIDSLSGIQTSVNASSASGVAYSIHDVPSLFMKKKSV